VTKVALGANRVEEIGKGGKRERERGGNGGGEERGREKTRRWDAGCWGGDIAGDIVGSGFRGVTRIFERGKAVSSAVYRGGHAFQICVH
jgi:hypothetical protein